MQINLIMKIFVFRYFSKSEMPILGPYDNVGVQFILNYVGIVR